MKFKITNPKIFLTWRRFDIAFKLAYLDLVLLNKSLAINIYSSHLKAFGLGRFKEPGNADKNSLNSFLDEFNKIYNNISKFGFNKKISSIPVSSKGVLINGSHRIASAIKLNALVTTSNVDDPPPTYDFNFFKSRGLSIEYIEFAATKFLEYSPNAHIAFLWPIGGPYEQSALRIIPNIIYCKTINLTYRGARNLLLQVYHNEKWLGSESDNFKGVDTKLASCFAHSTTVKIVLFHQPNLNKVNEIKRKIRALSNLGKHSIHITDNKAETIRISKLLLNTNGLHFINFSDNYRFKNNKKFVIEMKKFLTANKISSEDIIFDSGVVLQLYGLRQTNDIDFITSKICTKFNSKIRFDNHNNEMNYFNCSMNDLVYNPEYYFEFEGLKFTSLNTVLKMKTNRAEPKDKVDIKLINLVSHRSLKLVYLTQLQQSFLYLKIKSKISIIHFLRFFKAYKFMKAIFLKFTG